MSTLKNILSKYADPAILGGDGELSEKQISDLKKHLEDQRRTNFYMLIVCLLLIIAGLVYIISSSASTKQLENAIGKSSVVGVSIAGMFGFVLNTWKENNHIKLMLIFVKSMDGATLKSIIAEMWKKI